MTPRLALRDITKAFSGNTVLHGVALTVQPGEVHGLLGENGAGKSTMLNILSGVLARDNGSIEIDGKAVQITSPREATAAGIAMIHQELQQVPELSVAQNIFLGGALRKAGGLFVDRAAQEAAQLLQLPGPPVAGAPRRPAPLPADGAGADHGRRVGARPARRGGGRYRRDAARRGRGHRGPRDLLSPRP